MKVALLALLALLALNGQAIVIKNKSQLSSSDPQPTFDPYLEDDHRIILQADSSDPRWWQYQSSNEGIPTHGGIQGYGGLT